MPRKEHPTGTPRDLRSILADIRSLRAAFVGTDAARSAALDEALEAKRAEAVAERIFALEIELDSLSNGS